MPPSSTDYYPANCALIDPKIQCNGLLVQSAVSMKPFNHPYLFFCKLVASVLFSVIEGYSSFSAAINHVLCTGAKEKVIQVYARRIIAAMTDFHSWRDCAFEQCPHKPVSKPFLTVVTSLWITAVALCSKPFMAGAQALNALDNINIFQKVLSYFIIRGRSTEDALSVPRLPNFIEFVHDNILSRYANMFKS